MYRRELHLKCSVMVTRHRLVSLSNPVKSSKRGNQPILHFDISVGVDTDMFSFDQHRAKVAHV